MYCIHAGIGRMSMTGSWGGGEESMTFDVHLWTEGDIRIQGGDPRCRPSYSSLELVEGLVVKSRPLKVLCAWEG